MLYICSRSAHTASHEMAFNLGRFVIGGELKKYGSKFIRNLVNSECRFVGTSAKSHQQQQPQSQEPVVKDIIEESTVEDVSVTPATTSDRDGAKQYEIPANYRFRYPEFLPNPTIGWRNPIREKLERQDMIARRAQVHIPEFYVGSILKVTYSNIHQPDKTSIFLGICIERADTGLRSNFTLRNTIDKLGMEMIFDIYDPKIVQVDVMRLEKRLDDNLLYLRDALPEYSTFSTDMKAEIHREEVVPVNTTKVKLRPRPWSAKWHTYGYQGIEGIEDQITEKMKKKHQPKVKPYEKYDLMKVYRTTIPDEDQQEIYGEIMKDLEKSEAAGLEKKFTRYNKPTTKK